MNNVTVPLMSSAFFNENETRRALAVFVLDPRNQLSMGPMCREFESKFAEFQGRKHAVLFSSGSSANLALLQALVNMGSLRPGTAVGVSSLTWATNVMPVIQMGLHPSPVDVHPVTLNINSGTLRDALKSDYFSALFVTNALGFAGDLDEIARMCKKSELILLEDNCEALGTQLGSGKTGNFGLASTFSFYVAHHLSTIEGGMACTDSPTLDMHLRMVRAHGWDRDISEEGQRELREKFKVDDGLDSRYRFYELAYNMRPTEVTGFLGLKQMRDLPEAISRRQGNFLRIDKAIRKNKELIPVSHDNLMVKSIFAIPIVCATVELRNKYVERFESAGIEIRPIIAGNIVKQPFYRKYSPVHIKLAGATLIDHQGFYCSNDPGLTEFQLKVIEGAING